MELDGCHLIRPTLLKLAKIAHQLARAGWATVQYDRSHDLVQLAAMFGPVVPSACGRPLTDRLTVMDSSERSPRSLTGIYGRGAFPLHTDQAKVLRPPRFILLRLLEGDSKRPTLVARVNDIISPTLMAELRRTVWLVDGGRGRFYSSVVSSTPAGVTYVRFDRHCMRPACPESECIARELDKALEKATPQEIQWEADSVVILDNWTALHGRGHAVHTGPEHRVLERALVDVC